MKDKKEKKKKLPFKQRMFNKFLEKPITDVLIVSYELYHNSCAVYLNDNDILSFEDYCILVKNKLDGMYDFNSSVRA